MAYGDSAGVYDEEFKSGFKNEYRRIPLSGLYNKRPENPIIEYMRPLYEDENYWRFVDHFDFVDGPPSIDSSYTTENVTWKASFSIVNGSSQIWIERFGEPDSAVLIHTHPSYIKNISIEFDQNGKPLIVYESDDQIYLYWFNTLSGATEIKNLGYGITPVICTDSYERASVIHVSERFVFYVDRTTRKICGVRQSDRYDVVYTINETETRPVLEIIRVAKTQMGSLVIVACVRESDGSVSQIVLEAKPDGNAILGRDYTLSHSRGTLPSPTGDLTNFLIRQVLIAYSLFDQTSIPLTGDIDVFSLEEKIRTFSLYDQISIPVSGGILSFEHREAVITLIQTDILPQLGISGNINFNIYEAGIYINSSDSVNTGSLTGNITSFTLN